MSMYQNKIVRIKPYSPWRALLPVAIKFLGVIGFTMLFSWLIMANLTMLCINLHGVAACQH